MDNAKDTEAKKSGLKVKSKSVRIKWGDYKLYLSKTDIRKDIKPHSWIYEYWGFYLGVNAVQSKRWIMAVRDESCYNNHGLRR